MAKCQNRTTNFEYKVTGEWSFDGETWSPFDGDILPAQTANGQINGSPYSDADDMGLMLRINIGVRNTAGAAIESGTLSLVLVVDLKS